MAPASEIAILPLVSEAPIEDPSSDAGKVWKSTLDTVMAQDGYQRAYWGRQVESPDTLELVVGKLPSSSRFGNGSDSLSHHKVSPSTDIR